MAQQVSGLIRNLAQGISQQSPRVRDPSQGEIQENAFSSIAEGLTKRVPSQTIAKIANRSENSFYYGWQREGEERYIVAISDNNIRVCSTIYGDLPVSIAGSGPTNYLNTSNARQSFRCLAIQDVLLVSNVEIPVLRNTTNLPVDSSNNVEFWVRSVNYNTEYRITLKNGTSTYTSTYTTPLITSGEPIGTTLLAQKLATGGSDVTPTNGLFGQLPGGWVKQLKDSIIWVDVPPGLTTSISSSGGGASGLDASAIVCLAGELQDASDLPAQSRNGFTIKLQGLASSEEDNRWLKFETHTGEAGIDQGIWREVTEPGQPFTWNFDTMPHALVRVGTGAAATFYFVFMNGYVPPAVTDPEAIAVFQNLKWAARAAGDDETNPFGSIENNRIRDLFFYADRLGFLTTDSVLMSRTSDYFNLFGKSANEVFDDDPIDLTAASSRSSIFSTAFPLQQQVTLFADNTQWRLYSATNDIFTPSTAALELINTIPMARAVQPVSSGPSLLYSYTDNNYTQLREFFPTASADTQTSNLALASYITSQVPQYLPPDIWKMSSSEADSLLFALSLSERNVIYVYRWQWSPNGQQLQRVQQSWSKWVFPKRCVIHDASFIGDLAYLTTRYYEDDALTVTAGSFLELIDIKTSVGDLKNEPYLDRLFRNYSKSPRNLDPMITSSYDAATNRTSWTIEAGGIDVPFVSKSFIVVANDEPSGNQGLVLAESDDQGLWPDTIGTQILCKYKGDFSALKVCTGSSYKMLYRFSTPYLKDPTAPQGASSVADARGRLQIRTWTVAYFDSSHFEVVTTPKFRDSYSSVFNARAVDSNGNLVTDSQRALESGTFTVQVLSANDQFTVDLINESHFPSKFVSAQWLGTFSELNPSRRV